MADIELVIRISEEKYKDIQGRDWKNGKKWFSEEWQAIHNGTPLPKGHGRKFESIVVEYPPAESCTYPEYRGKPYFSIKYKENGEHIIGFGTYKPEVLSRYLQEYFIAPTIIEADTEESNTDNKSDDELYADAIDAFKVYATGRK